jgi:transposase
MGRPYSEDLRERVIAAVDLGGRVYEVAPVFQVSVSYIYKALGRRRATARKGRVGRKAKLAAHDEALRVHAPGRSPAWRSSVPTIAPRVPATFS